MTERLARAATIGSLVAALILFVLSAFETYNSTRALTDANTARALLVASLNDLRGMLSALKDGEASQRGYIITGRAEFLEPLRSGLPLARSKLHGVQAFGLVPKADLNRLGQLVEEKIEFLERSVRIRETQGFDAAAAVVRTGEGKSRMDLLRKEVATLENLYVNSLREREAAAESYARRTTTVVLLSSVLAGLLVAASVVLSGRDSATRARAERALAAEHAKLAATIASMPYGLVLFDRRGGIVLQNAAARELLKLPELDSSDQ